MTVMVEGIIISSNWRHDKQPVTLIAAATAVAAEAMQ